MESEGSGAFLAFGHVSGLVHAAWLPSSRQVHNRMPMNIEDGGHAKSPSSLDAHPEILFPQPKGRHELLKERHSQDGLLGRQRS